VPEEGARCGDRQFSLQPQQKMLLQPGQSGTQGAAAATMPTKSGASHSVSPSIM